MSIVSVHSYQMYAPTGADFVSGPQSQATVNPANGLQFNFAALDQRRPAADYDWTFTGPGSPAAQVDRFSGTVTFTGPGAGTIVLTIAAGAGPPAGGTFTLNVTASSGVQLMQQEEGAPVETTAELAPTDGDEVEVEEYDPYDHTVAEVVAEAESSNDPQYIRELITAEQAGKARSTLISQLQDILASLS